jgi:hypothetical protein
MSRRGLDELPVGKSEYERADFWIERRDFVDEVLPKPARTLVRLVQHALDRSGKTADGSFTVPLAIDDKLDEKKTYAGGSLLVHAAACSAVQILYEDERRYPWLADVRKTLPQLHDKIPAAFLGQRQLGEKDLFKRIKALDDPAFGALNPVTSAEVFWVLIRAGESYAHGTLGFLALFSMLWALKRPLHGRFKAGAALGRWRPSVAVTARCLQPILQLITIIEKRALLYREAINDCIELHNNEHSGNEYQRWRFASALERLSATLHNLAAISIDRKGVAAVAAKLTALANPIAPQTATESIAAGVRRNLRSLFVELGRQNESLLSGADETTNAIAAELIGIMKVANDRRNKILRRTCKLNPLWDAQVLGAEEARETCSRALKQLQRAVTRSRALPPENAFTHDVLKATLEEFAEINDNVAAILREAIDDNARWCTDSVTREVAFASAGNDSEFDAAELLSGLVIAQRTQQITRAAVEDAVRRAVRAALPDGSWISDQPIYLEKHFVGVWPRTVDLLDLLSNALRLRHGLLPGPDAADGHLLRYVGLLEARRAKKRPKWWAPKEEVWGFPSEAREEFIDVWETAMAVRGLLKIREVIEDRLWEICEDRFTIPSPKMTLGKLDPVDLGARHDCRLQTRLIRNAARTAQPHADPDADVEAEYSFLLHGPPGSSKTVIAEAIGLGMWKKQRIVRITPADFTRGGEGGVDLEARFIFRLLMHVRGVTIFFDEIDDLLRKRKIDAELSFIRLVIPGMLNRLQDLRDAAPRQEICFLLATNYVDQIEPALTRRGRIDAPVPVPYPDPWSRESILERVVAEEQENGRAIAGLPRDVTEAVVSRTAEWPWSTYQKLCRKVVASGCRTVRDVQALVEQFSRDFDSADYYYRNPERWKDTSPLVTEFAHFAFAASKLQHECRKRVIDLEQRLRARPDVSVDDLKLVDRFDSAWREAKRG